MSERSVLLEGPRQHRAAQRRARRRRRRLALGALAVAVLAVIALLTLTAGQAVGPGTRGLVRVRPDRVHPARVHHTTIAPTYGVALEPAADQVHFKQFFHVASAILFDVWTGRVLWEQNPGQRRPIASLTKMLTALVVASHSSPKDLVMITPDALHFSGSGVGLLPLGKRVNLVTLLYGLLLPSGNDAAIALADHVAGTQARFVALMNARARDMQLNCSHFTSPSGIVDQNNYSCTTDLAVLAHSVLQQPMLSPIVASRSAVLPFPIKGGKLFLWNNNPLLLARYPGADGVKTGYTRAAGPCLVATARRGHTWLGVVLLDSVNPAAEAQMLLNAGFAKLGNR